MLVKLLSGKSFFTQILLGIIFLILFFGKNIPLSSSWEDVLGVIAFILTLGVSILFFQNNNLIKYPGFAVWFFLFWMFPFSDVAFDFRMSASLFVCTLIFWRLLATEQSMENKKFFFDIGILLSISSFFYPPTLLLAGFLIFIFFYVQSINLKAFLLFFIGFSLPLVVGIQILYLTNQMDWLDTYQYAFCLDFWTSKVWALLPIGLMTLLIWIDHISHSGTQDINKRHKYFLTFLYFINLMVMLILFAGKHYETLAFMGIPITIFFTRFNQYQNSETLKEIILWGFGLVMVGFYFRVEISQFFYDLLGNVTL